MKCSDSVLLSMGMSPQGAIARASIPLRNFLRPDFSIGGLLPFDLHAVFREEIRDRHPQCPSQFFNISQRRIAISILNTGNVVAMESGTLRQVLLREI